jgi:two-component system OmpR family response regulator
MEKVKILVADDEPAILEIMSKRIAREGFEVTSVSDGAAAWQKIQSEAPDVVILDRTMPEMDGFTVLQMLRQNPPHKKWIPVIIVSARGEVKDLEDGMSLQADHYLVKPCPVEEIVKGIRLMLSLIPLRKADAEL